MNKHMSKILMNSSIDADKVIIICSREDEEKKHIWAVNNTEMNLKYVPSGLRSGTGAVGARLKEQKVVGEWENQL